MDRAQRAARTEPRTQRGNNEQKKSPAAAVARSLARSLAKSFISLATFSPTPFERELTALLPLWSSSDMRNRREEESEGKE